MEGERGEDEERDHVPGSKRDVPLIFLCLVLISAFALEKKVGKEGKIVKHWVSAAQSRGGKRVVAVVEKKKNKKKIKYKECRKERKKGHD